MRVWAEVFDVSGNKMGAPIVSIKAASINRILDSGGDFSFDVPGTDARALEQLKLERRVIVYAEENGKSREFFRGIIREVAFAESESGKTLVVNGPDILNELTRRNMWFAANFYNQRIETIAGAAFSVVPEWELVVTDSVTTTLSFPGSSVLAVIKKVADKTGLHFRLEEGRTLRLGALADGSGLRIYQHSGSSNAYENQDMAFIARLEYRVNSERIANVVSAIGTQQEIYFVGLAPLTGTTPGLYTVEQRTTIDGLPLPCIVDYESAGLYGEIEAVLSMPEVEPASSGAADLLNAAMALYTGAETWLSRNKGPQSFYNCTLKNVHKTILPGQTVYMQYRGDAWMGENKTFPVDIQGDLYVLRVIERFDQNGLSVSLELSDVDQLDFTEAEMIANLLEEVNRLD